MSGHAVDAALPLADLIEPGNFVMLTTLVGGEHTSRPLTVAEIDRSRLAFLVDRNASWVHAVADGRATVHATLSDVAKNTFLAMNGAAAVVDDRDEVARLWNPGATAYFDGADDPDAVVLRFDVTDGEYWDSPSGRLGRALALLRATVGDGDAAGERGPIEV